MLGRYIDEHGKIVECPRKSRRLREACPHPVWMPRPKVDQAFKYAEICPLCGQSRKAPRHGPQNAPRSHAGAGG